MRRNTILIVLLLCLFASLAVAAVQSQNANRPMESTGVASSMYENLYVAAVIIGVIGLAVLVGLCAMEAVRSSDPFHGRYIE